MPEYLSPGVYVEEVDTGNKPIEGVATSTAGFVGIAERGPIDPAFISNFTDYRRVFGDYGPASGGYLPYAVEGFFQNGGKRCFVARASAADAAQAKATIDGKIEADALGKGAWGNGVKVVIRDAGSHNVDNPADPANQLFKLIVRYWVPEILEDDRTLDNIALQEEYDNVSADNKTSSFYERAVNGFSALIELTKVGDGRPANSETPLADGDDGSEVTIGDLQGALRRMEEIDEVAILCCPEEDAFPDITARLQEQCEKLKDRFAIIQAPQNAAGADINKHRPPIVSKYAAYYFPWLRIRHPVTRGEKLIPPGGHIAGIYARSDIERGVHKAPANEVIRGLLIDPLDPGRGLQVKVTNEQQDLLNPRGVNALRYFTGRGNLIWGARTTILDPDWKYVNVRRLFIFIEESIEEATQWAVFEPNDEPLWARLRRSVSDFLTRVWMDGMLQGKTREEAYFVRCDRTTMTQADIDNGRLIMRIGIAPVKPAEFVIFRIGQWSGGSEVTEL